MPPNPSSSGGPSQDVVRGPATSHTPHRYDNVVLEDPKPPSGDYDINVTMCEAYGVH